VRVPTLTLPTDSAQPEVEARKAIAGSTVGEQFIEMVVGNVIGGARLQDLISLLCRESCEIYQARLECLVPMVVRTESRTIGIVLDPLDVALQGTEPRFELDERLP